MFAAIDNILGNAAKESKWAMKNAEAILQIVVDGQPKIARPDYCLGNKVIEFNGDFWHANPSFYNADDVMQLGGSEWIAKDVWEKDKKRLDAIRQQGYEILVVWERDYIKNKKTILESCANFLSNSTT